MEQNPSNENLELEKMSTTDLNLLIIQLNTKITQLKEDMLCMDRKIINTSSKLNQIQELRKKIYEEIRKFRNDYEDRRKKKILDELDYNENIQKICDTDILEKFKFYLKPEKVQPARYEYSCEKCNKIFHSFIIFKRHNLIHKEKLVKNIFLFFF